MTPLNRIALAVAPVVRNQRPARSRACECRIEEQFSGIQHGLVSLRAGEHLARAEGLMGFPTWNDVRGMWVVLTVFRKLAGTHFPPRLHSTQTQARRAARAGAENQPMGSMSLAGRCGIHSGED